MNIEEAQKFLEHYGYTDSDELEAFGVSHDLAMAPKISRYGSIDKATRAGLEAFQSRYGLAVTGKLDDATVALLEEPRCGFPDAVPFTTSAHKWSKTDLSYGFRELTPDLSVAQIKLANRAAMDAWSAVSPLTFTEGSNPDIEIRFVRGDHGDGAPFTTGVLAHAFYPTRSGAGLAGDKHYNDDYRWSVAWPVPSGSWDLIVVTMHELGHSLGLGHSADSGAIMYPYILRGRARTLHADDIAGIQHLYGAKPTPPPPPEPEPPEEPPLYTLTPVTPWREMELIQDATRWDFNHKEGSFVEIGTFLQGARVMVAAEAKHVNGHTYAVTLPDFHAGKPYGVNVLNLRPYVAPPEPEPPPPPPDPEPEPPEEPQPPEQPPEPPREPVAASVMIVKDPRSPGTWLHQGGRMTFIPDKATHDGLAMLFGPARETTPEAFEWLIRESQS